MKRFTKFALAGAVGLTLASAAAFAQPAPQDPPQAPEGAPAGPPPGRGLGPLLNRLLDKYDVNHDGQLDKTEIEAMRKDIQEGKLQPPLGPRGDRAWGGPRDGQEGQGAANRPDRPRDGQEGNRPRPNARGPQGPGPDGQGFRPPQDILDKYDLNKNGRLDPEERAALRQDVEDGKIPPPPRPPVPPRAPGVPAGPGMAQDPNGPDRPPLPPGPREVLRRFDTDKDGMLNEQELTAFLREMHQHRLGMQARRGPAAPERPLPPVPPQPER